VAFGPHIGGFLLGIALAYLFSLKQRESLGARSHP
jgi:membrane associated rhomboid family serine protease